MAVTPHREKGKNETVTYVGAHKGCLALILMNSEWSNRC